MTTQVFDSRTVLADPAAAQTGSVLLQQKVVDGPRLGRRGLVGCGIGLAATAWIAPAYAWPWSARTWPEVKQLVRKTFPGAPLLTVPELKGWLDDPARGKPLLVDVRGRQEFADSHLAGALQADGVDAAASLIAANGRDVPVVVYCSVGYRSGKVVEALMARGLGRIQNLEGSLFEWANSGLPVYQGGRVVATVHPYDAAWGHLLRRDLWSRGP